MKLRIVGGPEPREPRRWPEPLHEGSPALVIYDVRAGARDRELLTALRQAGLDGDVLLAEEGAERSEDLPPELGPGRWVRGHGSALVVAVQRERGPALALGAAAARAFTPGLAIRVDPGLRAEALGPMLRGVPADVTLREGWPSVLMPLIARSRR